jgi:hypothetical protein
MKIVFAVLCFTFTSLTPLIGAEYFVNSISGKDSNPGTSSSAPWKSLAPVETKKLQPGDIVNFARGSSWTKSAWETVFLIDDNGAKEKPITFRAYGEGDLPTFSNGGQVWNKGIKITASYVIIENLKVINTGYCGFEISKNANNNIIRKCEVENCGMGILCYGTRNLFTENYIHDLKMIVDNEIPDTQSGGADFGCVAFWLYGPNNEISYNKVYKSRGHSYDYQFDGGFIEFYENCDSTYAHHNWSDIGNGIAEGSNGHGNNITIAYNVFIEHSGLFAIHSNFSISNFKLENNTIINRQGTLWNNLLNSPTGMIIRNNIFVLGGKSSERVATTNNFTHTNNIYHLLNGAKLGSVVLGEGEKLGDPLFVDIENKDFRLQAGSPAIDSGKDLGYKIDFSNKTVPFGNAPDIGAFEYDTATGTSLLELKNDEKFFSLWPNPATNNFNLQVNSNSGVNLNLKIVNLLGQTVHSENHNSSGENSAIIPVSINLSPGVYMVMLSNGFTHATDTLIVQ